MYLILFCEPGDSHEEEAREEGENLTDKEESDKEVESVSQERHIEQTEGSPSHAEESDEEGKPECEEELEEDVETGPQDEDKSDEDEKDADEVSKGSKEEADDDDKSDSEGNEESNDVGNSPSSAEKSHMESPIPTTDAGVDELSDDEPLVCTSNFLHT